MTRLAIPVEQRLRERLDAKQDRIDLLERQLANTRARADKWRRIAYDLKRARDLWKHRAMVEA